MAELLPVPAGEWDAKVAALDGAHFLQSAVWAGIKVCGGWRSELLCASESGRPVAYASVLSRSPGRSPLPLAYVPRGPLLVRQDESSLSTALDCLERLARERRYLFVKADPDIWDEEADSWARPLMIQRGWRLGQQVQFRNTATLDISAPEDEILAGMKPKTRYNVGLAARRGVVVQTAARDELGELYALYLETAVRDGFIIRPRLYYDRLWGALLDAGMATVLLAWHEGRPLAGIVAVAHGRTAWYLHGASATEGRNLMATYVLQWEAIRWARQRGCRLYDMWGAPETLDDSDPMAGLLRFKLGFGASFRQGLGAWDYSPYPLLYTAYRLATPRLLQLRRGWRKRAQRRE